MTIPASMPIRVVYLGDGATVNYPIPFAYFANADGTKQLSVVVADSNGENETVLVENTNFTITAAGQPNGTLTLNAPLETGKKLTIVYNIPIEQTVDWEEFGRLPSESIERSFDKVIAILKQHQEILDRCVKVVISGNQTPQELLDDVYDKLDSATEIAATATTAANNATSAAQNAMAAVESAEETLESVTEYVDTAKTDIAAVRDEAVSTVNAAVTSAQAAINQTIEDANESIDATITEAVADVKQQAVSAAEETIADAAVTVTNTAKANLNEYVDETVEPSLQSYMDAAASSAAAAEQSADAAADTSDAFSSLASTATENFNTNAAEKTTAVNQAATNAANSASAALDSQTAAAVSASSAEDSADLAEEQAEIARIINEGTDMEVQNLGLGLSKSCKSWNELLSSGNIGLPPDNCKKLTIKETNGTYYLRWADPSDTVVDNQVLCTWAGTMIVRKAGGYPTNPYDGTIIKDNKEANAYSFAWLTDTPTANEDGYFYAAFPYSANGAFNLDNRNRFGAVVYEVIVDKSDADPAGRVKYWGENIDYTPAKMNYTTGKFEYGSWKDAFFMPRVVMLKQDGTEAYELNPDDYSMKMDGTDSDYKNTDFSGNVMVAFPQVWLKYEQEGNRQHYYIANMQVDSSYHCYTHINKNGQLVDWIYKAAYKGANVNNVIRSLSGLAPMNTQTSATERSYCQANGDRWFTGVWADRQMINTLLLLMGKSTDTQTVYGHGYTDGGSSAGSLMVSGKLDKYGLFYGTNTNDCVKVFGIEHYWGNQWERIAGYINDHGTQKVKLTWGTEDGSTTTGYNETGSGYISVGLTPGGTSGGYVSSATLTAYGLVSQTASGSSTTYECDGFWFNDGQTNYALVGGDCDDGARCGAFCSRVAGAPSIANWNIGCCLSYK